MKEKERRLWWGRSDRWYVSLHVRCSKNQSLLHALWDAAKTTPKANSRDCRVIRKRIVQSCNTRACGCAKAGVPRVAVSTIDCTATKLGTGEGGSLAQCSAFAFDSTTHSGRI
jgi:hypothetical protein